MRKYLFIFKSELMTNLNYILNLLFGFFGYFIMLYIFVNLWKYLYSNPNELINGYSMSQMIWYVFITELFYSVTGGKKLFKKITKDVKDGNIAYNINKPYSYVGYILSSHLGSIFFKFIIYTILAFIVGIIFVGSFPIRNIIKLVIFLVTCVLAIVINTLFLCSLALLAFYIEDAGPLQWVYSKLILVFGTIFPIEFFGKTMAKILKFTPIFVMAYGPAKLFVNFRYKDALVIIIAQIIYIFIAYMLCNFVYGRGVKKLNVNGG